MEGYDIVPLSHAGGMYLPTPTLGSGGHVTSGITNNNKKSARFDITTI